MPVERACRTGGGGWVHLKGANCMAASGFRRKKRPWLALGGHFSPPFHKMGLGMIFWPCRATISGSEVLFSLCRDNHWPTAVTIKSLLESGSDLSHGSTQDVWNGTFVKLEMSKPT